MVRYFEVVEIEKDDFIDATGKDLDCCQLVVPVGARVLAAVDEDEEYEIQIPLDCFE